MSTIKVGTLLAADGSTTTQPSIPALAPAMARVWCKWHQNNQVIDGSYGVSSITDTGVGHTRVTFSTALSSGNHATVLSDDNYGNSFVSSHSSTTVVCSDMNLANDGYADALMNVVVFGS